MATYNGYGRDVIGNRRRDRWVGCIVVIPAGNYGRLPYLRRRNRLAMYYFRSRLKTLSAHSLAKREAVGIDAVMYPTIRRLFLIIHWGDGV